MMGQRRRRKNPLPAQYTKLFVTAAHQLQKSVQNILDQIYLEYPVATSQTNKDWIKIQRKIVQHIVSEWTQQFDEKRG